MAGKAKAPMPSKPKAKTPGEKYIDELTHRDTVFKWALAGDRDAACDAIQFWIRDDQLIEARRSDLEHRDEIFKAVLMGSSKHLPAIYLKEAIRARKELPDNDLNRYLRICFERMLRGEDARSAFNLKVEGRPPMTRRDALLVAHYEYWQQEDAAGRTDVDFQKLQDELADAFGMDTEAVKKQIQRFKRRRDKGQ